MSISLPNGTLLATPQQQTQYTAAVTRILHLSNFPAELKTRDLQLMFKEYENDKGGFRIKWVDDTNALVVFADAGIAKRAYLTFLLSPPPSFPPPALIKPYDKPDAPQIIQTLAARAMGHRSSMSNFSQQIQGQVPLGVVPGNGAAIPSAYGVSGGVDGLPNAQHGRSASMNKGPGGGGAGWTFPNAASRVNGGVGVNGSAQPAPGAGAPQGLAGRTHGRTGSASFSRSAMGGVGGGALSFGGSSGGGVLGGSSGGGGPSLRTGALGSLATHDESLDSPAIPAGFSTTRQEGVGGGSSRRLTGRPGGAGAGGGAGSFIGGASGSGLGFGGGGGGALSFGAPTRQASTGASQVQGRSDSRHSVRSGDSSDNEPIVIMDEPSSATSPGNTIDGRGKVPFGQWKMPSSASVSPNPNGNGGGNGGGGGGFAARRDSVSADKALREVEKALRGVEAQG